MTTLTNPSADKQLFRSHQTVIRWPTLTVLATALLFAGCSVVPHNATPDEVRSRVSSDTSRMYVQQAPIAGPVTVEEAVARTLKYNLDYRLKKMESALALGLSEYSNYDMLPNLLVSAGYRTRSNLSGGSSIGINDGIESLRPSSSEERQHGTAGAEFSWNLLDFGVSYYRARQQADLVMVAEERRRKVVQNMVQDVRSAYWRALGAQRMSARANEVLKRANLALARSREAEAQRLIPPALALSYQRALLDATTLLNLRRQDLEFAKRELAALMNVEPGVEFTVAESAEAALPAPPNDSLKLEDMALLQRPELREEDFKSRITVSETRRQLLSMLPGISFDAGYQYDSNKLLANNDWAQSGVRVSWNLMRLAALPALKGSQEQQVRTDESRRMALSMAILTQVRVGIERYRFAVEDFKLADLASQVDDRLAKFTRDSVTSKLDSELEAIRTDARAVLGSYQRLGAYSNAQIAFGRLYNTLGFDPLPDDFDADDLPKLTERVKAHLKSTEVDTLKMSSQLFGYVPSVSIHVAGVDDPVTLVRMHAQISELLARYQIEVDDRSGTPLTLSLARSQTDGQKPGGSTLGGLETATWQLTLGAERATPIGQTSHSTTLPSHSRGSTYEAALVATLTSKMPEVRHWLATMVEGAK